MPKMNSNLARILKPYVIDYLGFADLTNYQSELAEYGRDIVKGYQSGISIGLAIPHSIVDFLPQRADPNIACEYQVQGYEVLNNRLNIIASIVSSYLNQAGYRTLPIPAPDRTDKANGVPTVSHKMVAHIAGLGWIGKNCLLITPERGPRLRLVSILTNAPLDTVDGQMEQRCGDCLECAQACPAGAIKGRNYISGESRDVRLDFFKCQQYIEDARKSTGYAVCGMCLYACPYGKQRLKT